MEKISRLYKIEFLAAKLKQINWANTFFVDSHPFLSNLEAPKCNLSRLLVSLINSAVILIKPLDWGSP